MSLVGTRPPTVDEWEQYELHHRSRMSTKPGITGMWQVSGRSDITDFEEVVRLDDWMFTITVSKISEVQEDFEPRVIKSKGTIQQYPDWDEDDFDEE